MPCDQIQTSSIALEKADRDLLAQALKAEGWQVVVSGERLLFSRHTREQGFVSGVYDGHNLTLQTQQYRGVNVNEVVNSIKRAYSTQVVQAASTRFGWRVQQKAPGKFIVQRRG